MACVATERGRTRHVLFRQHALSTATGQVLGGHVAAGCLVRTTAEVLLALLPDWQFTREPDATTGYDELVVRAKR